MKFTKAICIFTVACLCFLSLCSCNTEDYALTVNSVKVSKGVFGYYLSVAVNSPGFKDIHDKENLASKLCAEYVAGNKLIEKYGIELSAKEKVVVSSELKTNWQLYSSFYEKYSVSKQTLCLMLEYESLIDRLVETVYSETGDKPLENEEILSFFNSHYAVAKVMFTPFTAEMTQDDIKAITDKYTAMANAVRAGGDFSSAAQLYPDLSEYEDAEHIVSSFDSSYPKDFFKNVAQTKVGETHTLRYKNGIYLVKKSDSSPFFELYKSECIVKMKKSEVLSELQHTAQNSNIEFNTRIISQIMRTAEV